MKHYDNICIGVDQSYSNTGVSIICDGQITSFNGIYLVDQKSHSDARMLLADKLTNIMNIIRPCSKNIVCLVERIRLRSRGFININYIKSIGALNATIVDVMNRYNVDVYSVDTRAWKAQVVGTTKGKKNKYGVPEEKWPTVKWVCDQGFRDKILKDVSNTRMKNGCFYSKDGSKLMFDNDVADAIAIGMYYFVGNLELLKLEK